MIIEYLLTHAAAFLIIAGFLFLSLRRTTATDYHSDVPRDYRVHGAWYVFSAIGAIIVIGIFLLAGWRSPSIAGQAAIASGIAAALFVFLTYVLAKAYVRIDGTTLICSAALGERRADLRMIRSVELQGLNVTVTFHPERIGEKSPRPITFMAAFRNLSELLDILRKYEATPQKIDIVKKGEN